MINFLRRYFCSLTLGVVENSFFLVMFWPFALLIVGECFGHFFLAAIRLSHLLIVCFFSVEIVVCLLSFVVPIVWLLFGHCPV